MTAASEETLVCSPATPGGHATNLEHVTLALHVELVVEVAVDLLRLAVPKKHTTEDTLAPDPHDLGRHAGVGRTLALTEALVPTEGTSLGVAEGTGTRVHCLGLPDDQTILDELVDALACRPPKKRDTP